MNPATPVATVAATVSWTFELISGDQLAEAQMTDVVDVQELVEQTPNESEAVKETSTEPKFSPWTVTELIPLLTTLNGFTVVMHAASKENPPAAVPMMAETVKTTSCT